MKYHLLSLFVDRTHHEIRGPLATILGLCYVVKNEVKEKTALKYFEMINRTALSLEEILRDLQRISIVTSHELHPLKIDILDEIEMIKGNLISEANFHSIKFEYEIESTGEIVTDKLLLNDIFNNLMVNAVKYADLKKESPEVKIKVRKLISKIEVTIADNGQGIPYESLDLIWDMFYRANHSVKGNGLGLYIVKEGIERLNGTIHVDSKIGIGTTFKLILPKILHVN